MHPWIYQHDTSRRQRGANPVELWGIEERREVNCAVINSVCPSNFDGEVLSIKRGLGKDERLSR
jgi:hypothetical protein